MVREILSLLLLGRLLATWLLELAVEGAEIGQVVLSSLQTGVRLNLVLPHVVVVHVLGTRREGGGIQKAMPIQGYGNTDFNDVVGF